jgi:hypothetical protein
LPLPRATRHAGNGRFDTTLICGDCNSADGAAKRRLGLPPTFSFTPTEIRTFVVGKPHAGITIDYAAALSAYRMTLGCCAVGEADPENPDTPTCTSSILGKGGGIYEYSPARIRFLRKLWQTPDNRSKIEEM